MAVNIRTSRLDLIPMTPAFLRASLDRSTAQASQLIGLTLPETWPDSDDLVSLRLRQLEADPALQPWLLRAIALRSDGQMIGHIGFHTGPGARYLDSGVLVAWNSASPSFHRTAAKATLARHQKQ